jgi:hypothetical protein
MYLMAEYSDNWCSNDESGDILPVSECDTFSDAKGISRRDKLFPKLIEYTTALIDYFISRTGYNPPSPDLVSVTGIPTEIQEGTPFNIQVTSTNQGFGTDDGYVNISVLYDDETSDLTISNISAPWDDTPIYYQPGQGPIFSRYCEQIPGGADHHLIEAHDLDWQNNETHTLSFQVTPKKPGNILIRVRTTMRKPGVCEYENDYSVSGGTTNIDQQGWEVVQFLVPVDEITKVYLPLILMKSGQITP